MNIVEVTNSIQSEHFFQLPIHLYKEDKNWIQPLDKEIRAVFAENLNPVFKRGKLKRWILKKNHKVIGRIAAFIDNKIVKLYSPSAGGVGFFECIDSQEAANLLFDTAINWLKENKMEVADGPINFGKRNRWWGLLVDGFEMPNYGMNYNFDYYQNLFENYGFLNYYEQYTFRGDLTTRPDEAKRNVEEILNDPAYRFEHINLSKIDYYASTLVEIYNKAWLGHEGTPKITEEDIAKSFKQNKNLIDKRLIWFAYHNDKPIAFLVFLPEFGPVLQKLKGKLGLIQKLKFLYYKKKGLVQSFVGNVYGIIPEFQGKDITSAFCVKVEEILNIKKPSHYKYFELNWIGDFNPKMISLAKRLGTKEVKTFITYRYMLDPNIKFSRCKKINLEN